MNVPGTTCILEASRASRLTLLRAAMASRVSPGFVVMATVVGGPDGMSTFWPGCHCSTDRVEVGNYHFLPASGCSTRTRFEEVSAFLTLL